MQKKEELYFTNKNAQIARKKQYLKELNTINDKSRIINK